VLGAPVTDESLEGGSLGRIRGKLLVIVGSMANGWFHAKRIADRISRMGRYMPTIGNRA
jgi:hypothetical protein